MKSNLAYQQDVNFDPGEYEAEETHTIRPWIVERRRKKAQEKERETIIRIKKRKIKEQVKTGLVSLICCFISGLIGKFYYSDMWLLAFGFGIIGATMIISAFLGKIVIY